MTGSPRAVAGFVDRIALTVTRRVAGVTTRDMAPFSFKSLYKLTNRKGVVPCDPYDMVRWPIVRRGRTAYVRYRFHTRNMEILNELKALSRKLPEVTFALVTHCLDDGEFAPFTIAEGRLKTKRLGEAWRQPFWERTAQAMKIDLDDAYEDDIAEMRAESRMLDEAMCIATGSDRRYEWSGGRIYRDLWDERAAMMNDLATALKKLEGK